MGNETGVIAIGVLTTFGAVSFLLLIVGLFKPSLVMRRASLQTRGGIIFFWGGLWILTTVGATMVATIAGQNLPESPTNEPREYYVGAKGANIRSCPQISCSVIDTVPQNTLLSFPGDLYDKYPDWAEVTLQGGEVGYISKTTLASEMTAAPPKEPSDDEIFLGPFEPLEPFYIGYTYTISFCYPDSARSGATCGGLAGETQNPVGGSPPYSIIKKSGFLPPGMTLELNGLLSGSPTTVGTYNFKLCAKDLQMNEGCQDYTFVVARETEASPASSPASEPVAQPIADAIPDYGNTIDSMTCSLTPSKNEYDDFSNAKYLAKGTTWGPVGTAFSTGSSYAHLVCGSWTYIATNASEYCKRGPDDPERATWSEDSAWSTQSNSARIIASTKCCYHPTQTNIVKDYPSKKNDVTQQCSR